MDTKSRLLEQAARVFAEKGYDGASVRDITDAAAVNISAIRYYFGGKKELYNAILESFAFFVRRETADVFDRAESLIGEGPSDPEKAKDCLCDLFSELCRLLFSDKSSDPAIKVFFGEYLRMSESFRILDENLIRPVKDLTARLLFVATGRKLTKRECYLHAFPLLTQLFVFKTRQNEVLSVTGWSRYGKEERAAITDVCLAHLRAVLNDLAGKA